MKAFIVDDEYLMIQEMEFQLSSYPNLKIAGTYSNASHVLEDAEEKKPDVIFMDIDMPGMSGLDLALKLTKQNPNIAIVFVTAYSEYALDAYKAYPIDYLLKPIGQERLFKTLDHIAEIKNLQNIGSRQENTKIKCFGRFEFVVPKSKNQQEDLWCMNNQKEKMLWAYLIFRSDKSVSRKELMNLMFDGVENRKTINYLHVMIHSIRKQLDEFDINCTLHYSGGNYTLKIAPGVCDFVDFMTFANQKIIITADNKEKATQMVSIFCHDYMEEEDFPWIAETQEWLENRYVRLMLQLSEYYKNNAELSNAETCLRKLIDRFPLIDEGWQAMLDFYLSTDKSAFIKLYPKYCKMLKTEFDEKPSAFFEENYKKIKKS
ncbi:MAG TPA: response regulator [Ruminiclostridium sp.]|nr:response regulator [Ruminiclostridium sp.]